MKKTDIPPFQNFNQPYQGASNRTAPSSDNATPSHNNQRLPDQTQVNTPSGRPPSLQDLAATASSQCALALSEGNSGFSLQLMKDFFNSQPIGAYVNSTHDPRTVYGNLLRPFYVAAGWANAPTNPEEFTPPHSRDLPPNANYGDVSRAFAEAFPDHQLAKEYQVRNFAHVSWE